MTLDCEPLQNYNLIYGKEVPWSYQIKVLKELKESGKAGDIRYIRFRELEKTSTLRVSPKHEGKPSGTPVAFIEITGENEGIREYLLYLNIGRQIDKTSGLKVCCKEVIKLGNKKLCRLDPYSVEVSPSTCVHYLEKNFDNTFKVECEYYIPMGDDGCPDDCQRFVDAVNNEIRNAQLKR